jgi:hypothetical protein
MAEPIKGTRTTTTWNAAAHGRKTSTAECCVSAPEVYRFRPTSFERGHGPFGLRIVHSEKMLAIGVSTLQPPRRIWMAVIAVKRRDLRRFRYSSNVTAILTAIQVTASPARGYVNMGKTKRLDLLSLSRQSNPNYSIFAGGY